MPAGLPGAGRQEPTFVTDHVIISGNMGRECGEKKQYPEPRYIHMAAILLWWVTSLKVI